MKIIILYFFLFCSILQARDLGQIEITTEEGVEVYQKEKYYLLKKNVKIVSDTFNLTAQKVKAYFDKDLYDITEIYSQGNVVLESNQGLRVLGNEVDYSVKNQNIEVRGKNCFLKNNNIIMKSDKSISVNNTNGKFKLFGSNSQLINDNINIMGENIEGIFANVNGENIVKNLMVEDKKQVNIKTETLNMFALRAEFNNETNIIKLFDNVKIIRNNKLITGDYAEMNTLNESYKIRSLDSKRVKILLEKADE